MGETDRGNELGEFLKARRTQLPPDTVPASDPRRRTQGLRREEVAALASISTDYYTRIEQGRRSAPAGTLEAIARALRLDDDGRAYLFELSGKNADRKRQRRTQKPSPHLDRLIRGMPGFPALVFGRRMDILTWNDLAAELLMDFSAVADRHRNYVRILFTEPAMRSLYRDWESVAQLCVAQLHMDAARDPHDRRLRDLVGELSVTDPDFRRWWSEHRVAVRNRGTKTFDHPLAGELTLEFDTLSCVDDPDQQLVVWTAQPGSDSEQRLQTLAQGTRPRTSPT